jgi:tetratricopeptide (TPR) repeat protein
VVKQVYQTRVGAATFASLGWQIIDTSSTTFYLTQLYAHAVPVKIGDCYFQLGLFAKAEEYYLQASTYTYLNTQIEATSLWIRLAQNAVEWGDALYKNEDTAGATAQYTKLINADASVPNSFLYLTASLTDPATAAKTLIHKLKIRPGWCQD